MHSTLDQQRVVVGRVAGDVRRVEVDWGDGRRADAWVDRGLFLARVPGLMLDDPRGREDALGQVRRIMDTPPVTVTAYGGDGGVLGRHEDVPPTPWG